MSATPDTQAPINDLQALKQYEDMMLGLASAYRMAYTFSVGLDGVMHHSFVPLSAEPKMSWRSVWQQILEGWREQDQEIKAHATPAAAAAEEAEVSHPADSTDPATPGAADGL